MSHPKHTVLILPGLSDNVRNIERATSWWKSKDLIPYVIRVGWRDANQNFEVRFNEILSAVDKIADESKTISILGTSAGSSMAFNIFLKRYDVIKNAVNICGRLRSGDHRWRSLERMSRSSELFKKSVLCFEENGNKIPQDLRSRMMCVRARFGDEFVPSDTNILLGAKNIQIPTFEHMLSITMALTIFAKPVIEFMKD